MAVTRFDVVRSGPDVFNPPRAWPRSDQPEPLPPADAEWFAWRLLLSNNRDVGRSAVIFATRGECLAHIHFARELAGMATLTYPRTGRRWAWVLGYARATLAVSSRVYELERECRYAASLFLGGVAGAAVPD